MEYGMFDERLGRSSEKMWLLSIEEKKKRLKEVYKRVFGYELDFDNLQSFNEKLQWYKLYYDNPEVSRCIDKVTFKDYISEKIGDGYTAKLLKVWESPDELSFDDLPDTFIIKSNCQDHGNYIKIIKDKNNCDLEAIKEEIKKFWFNPLNLLINGFCKGYYGVTPKVLAEEYIEHFSDNDLIECKIFCFDGKPVVCNTQSNHIIDGKMNRYYSISFYTLDWERIELDKYGDFPPFYNAPKPYHLNELIELSKKLSKDFPHVRVDFMDTVEKIYLGEMTFYPGGGLDRYEPSDLDFKLGSYFNINNI